MASPFTTRIELLIVAKSYRGRSKRSYPSFVAVEFVENLANAGKLQGRGDVRQTRRVEKAAVNWENYAQETVSALQIPRPSAILSKGGCRAFDVSRTRKRRMAAPGVGCVAQ
jgi:hypothetical protein